MRTIEPTGNHIWGLFYRWWDNSDTMWWGAYDSLEALLFDFDNAYRNIAYNSDDDITDEKITWAKEELKENACVEIHEIGLCMNIEPMMVYGLGNRGE